MRIPFVRLISLILLASASLLGASAPKAAENHVVPLAQLRQAVRTSAQNRQTRISKVEQFFSSPRVVKTLKSAHIDPVQVRQAIPQLSDQELAQLSARTQQLQRDFAGGSLSNQQITYILIALATALLVTIIFVS